MDQKLLEKIPQPSLGRLISSVDDQEIDYQLVEIAHHSIGFAASKDLEPGMTIHFVPRSGGKSYTLLIVSAESLSDQNLHKFRAVARTTQIDFEQLCEEVIVKYRETAPTLKDDWNVRSIRFITEPSLDVDVKTFGAGRSYHVQTANISRSGVLLVTQNKQKLPFNIGTLVEITVRPSQFYDIQEIKGTGKVVRHTGLEFDAKKQYIGSTFTDLDALSTQRWSDLLTKIELALSVRF